MDALLILLRKLDLLQIAATTFSPRTQTTSIYLLNYIHKTRLSLKNFTIPCNIWTKTCYTL